MTGKESLWIGADPGGIGNFGIACLKFDGSVYTCCVDCADEAIHMIIEQTKVKPLGIGVDAPLWWSSGRSSDRQADRWLRKRYRLSGGQVQTANSLQGAALIQGVMFVYRIRQLFPEVNVTETHPKAILKALALPDMEAFSRRFSVKMISKNEHERDAVISAVAAREGFEHRWPHDLTLARNATEQDPLSYWLAPIHYFWPEN
jgi:predicted nuclease with RNAse H fold